MKVFLLLLSLSAHASELVTFADLTIKHKMLSDFNDWAMIESIVPLETTDHSLLASAEDIYIDKKMNRIYIADYDSSNAVKIFNMDGKYEGQVSRAGKGPGEYPLRLMKFVVLPDSSIILITSTTLYRYDEALSFKGELDFRTVHGIRTGDVSVIGDHLYFNSIFMKKEKKDAIFVFDKNFDVKRRFHFYDQRVDKYAYNVFNTLMVHKNELWVKMYYDLGFNVYSPDGELLRKYIFPQSNSDKLKDLWSVKDFKEQHRRDIKQYSHRFSAFYSFGGSVLLFDSRKKPSRVYRMMKLKGKELTVYQGYHPYKNAYAEKSLLLMNIAGKIPGGLIAVIEHDEHFDKIKGNYPALADLELTSHSNPVLMMLKPVTE